MYFEGQNEKNSRMPYSLIAPSLLCLSSSHTVILILVQCVGNFGGPNWIWGFLVLFFLPERFPHLNVLGFVDKQSVTLCRKTF